jgi:peptidoglycan/xylan/chitin deacetylase (PgdA/CDA1 family)
VIGLIRPRDAWHRLIAANVPVHRFLRQGPAGSGSICLTFDDGPHPRYTPRLLDALGAHGLVATFFVLGSEVERYPGLVRRIAAEGHAIGNHTFSHGVPWRTSCRRLIEEIRRTGDLIADHLGMETRLFRPPYGRLSVSKLLKVWSAGQSVVLWNADSRDYVSRSADEVRSRFRKRTLRGGDLVLMHDNQPHAIDLVPELAASARERGLSFSTVETWVGWPLEDRQVCGIW